jgi:hypothetical protein
MLPNALGVGRLRDNDKALLVHFARPLTDDELRLLHDLLARRAPPPATAADCQRMMEALQRGARVFGDCAAGQREGKAADMLRELAADRARLDWLFSTLNSKDIAARIQQVEDAYVGGGALGVPATVRAAIDFAMVVRHG